MFAKKILVIEIEKTQILIKTKYLGIATLELRKILMYKVWCDYVKPRYGEQAKRCYMDTDSFIVYIKTDDIYKDIAEDVQTRFDTSNYCLKEKKKK